MSPNVVAVLIVVPTAAVVAALFVILWRERSSTRSATVAIVAGTALAAWAAFTAKLALAGRYLPPGADSPPPIGIQLVVAMAVITACIAVSPTLRGLLTNQKTLLRLNVWRLVGAVFVGLMLTGQVPALWALPAGIGDVLVGLAAFPVAKRLGAPGGRSLAVWFNLAGVADLVVAVGLGIASTLGPLQLFHTTPTAELLTQFPLALVPGFLVPLAFMVHFASLWQLAGLRWLGDAPSDQHASTERGATMDGKDLRMIRVGAFAHPPQLTPAGSQDGAQNDGH